MELRDRRNLPAEVLARLEAAGVAERSGVQVRSRLVEERRWDRVELRDAGPDTQARLVGYASTFDQAYPVLGGSASGFGWDEMIAAGAFDKTLREAADVRLLINHTGIPLARTASGTMELRADDVGLVVDAEIDRMSPMVQSLASAMRRGDMDQMSFAFEVVQQDWSPDYMQRTIREVKLYDVSVVTYPANEATMAMMRADPVADSAAPEPVDVPTSSTASTMSLRLARAQLDQARERFAAAS